MLPADPHFKHTSLVVLVFHSLQLVFQKVAPAVIELQMGLPPSSVFSVTSGLVVRLLSNSLLLNASYQVVAVLSVFFA